MVEERFHSDRTTLYVNGWVLAGASCAGVVNGRRPQVVCWRREVGGSMPILGIPTEVGLAIIMIDSGFRYEAFYSSEVTCKEDGNSLTKRGLHSSDSLFLGRGLMRQGVARRERTCLLIPVIPREQQRTNQSECDRGEGCSECKDEVFGDQL